MGQYLNHNDCHQIIYSKIETLTFFLLSFASGIQILFWSESTLYWVNIFLFENIQVKKYNFEEK